MKKKTTLMIITMVMIITCLVPITSHASESDIKYTYDSDSKTLTFSGTGVIAQNEGDDVYHDDYFNKAEHIVIEDGITGIGNFAFFGFAKVKTIEFPKEMYFLGQQAFYGCKSLEEVHLPDGVTYYEWAIFEACESLETVYFGGMPTNTTVVFATCNMFQDCHKLKNIYVPESNEFFSVKDGVLFADTILLCYPETKTDEQYEIPEGTTGIGSVAFLNNEYLENVFIPETVKVISDSFISCSSLTSLTIPSSVTEFTYDEVVRGCDKLEYIKNDSDVEVKLFYDFNPEGMEFWVDRESGKYIDGIANGIADKVILDNRKYKGETIKVDGVTYKLMEKTNELTLDEMNSGVARADVKAVKFGDEYKTSSRIKHKGWYYDVINPEVSPVSKISETSINYTNARLVKGDYDSIYVSWNKVDALGPKVSYKIEVKKQDGQWTVLKKAAVNNNCTLNNLDDGAKYLIRVTPHITVNGETYYGNAKVSTGIHTLKKLNKPNVTKAGSAKVKVTWNNINGETGYEIYKSTKMNKNFKFAKRIVSTTAKSTSLSADKNVKYYYKIRAYKNIKINGKVHKVYGPWSEAKGYKLK